jgi:hypothetical protein
MEMMACEAVIIGPPLENGEVVEIFFFFLATVTQFPFLRMKAFICRL